MVCFKKCCWITSGKAFLNLFKKKLFQVVADEIDGKILSRIDEKKRALQRINEKGAAMKRAKKEAYFHHIYHTVGIEGNTMTLSQTR